MSPAPATDHPRRSPGSAPGRTCRAAWAAAGRITGADRAPSSRTLVHGAAPGGLVITRLPWVRGGPSSYRRHAGAWVSYNPFASALDSAGALAHLTRGRRNSRGRLAGGGDRPRPGP